MRLVRVFVQVAVTPGDVGVAEPVRAAGLAEQLQVLARESHALLGVRRASVAGCQPGSCPLPATGPVCPAIARIGPRGDPTG